MGYKPRILFTIGYGNQAPELFIERLTQHKVDMVYDVRRADSRSWCRVYYPGYYPGTIGDFLDDKAGISYSRVSSLGKSRLDTLQEYALWLASDNLAMAILDDMAKFIDGNSIVPCILCAERDFRQCHRSTVASSLILRLNTLAEQECDRIANEAGSNVVVEWPCRWAVQHI